MSTYTYPIKGFYLKASATDTTPQFGVSTDGTLIMETGASFAAAVTTVPPRSILIKDKAAGLIYKIPAYVTTA